ncbi:maleylpyruvate isomerase family mycothiol-dependent enzyme [Streptomyces sp. NPDC048290]|uniref:maleylpyruvate isomerase family mycothiol-dependent enzyme n=1 Tax=Streptomyces sp. NPDC048290 TaxID=3155811 RepID=UPI00342B3869
MTLLAFDRYCDEIALQVGQFRELVTAPGVDLGATVPTCPDWTVEDLVRHMGEALRWVEVTVRTRAGAEVASEDVPEGSGPEGRGDAVALGEWFAAGGEMLVRTLREAGPDAGVWGWAGVHTAAFWARRMTHEITVHRADLALAVGEPYGVAGEVAVDAIDEWLEIVTFVQRNDPHDAARELRGESGGAGASSVRSIHLHATDAEGLDAEWVIELGAEGVVWRRGHEKASVALRGSLTGVMLAFYRRVPLVGGGVEVVGDRGVLEFWLERASFG